MSQHLCHSSRIGTVVGTTGQLDLRKEIAAKTNCILSCRSRNSQEISALTRPQLDTASCFGTRNTWTIYSKCSGGALVDMPKEKRLWELPGQEMALRVQQQPQHQQGGDWEHS